MDNAEITHALNVIWGIGDLLTALKSPYGQELHDAVIVLKEALAEVDDTPLAYFRPAAPYLYYSERLSTPYLIVMHSTRSGRANFTDEEELQGTLRWFQNPTNPQKSSAHFVVDKTAGVTPVVPLSRVANHARGVNGYSYGIECTQPMPSTPYTEGHYQGAAECVREINKYHLERGWPEIPIERLLADTGAPGIIGHEVTRQGKIDKNSDPGDLWDWQHFISILR